MQGAVIQVSVSRGGVPKRAIGEGVLTPLGVEGDAWAHPAIHGGPRQAVLVVCAEAVDELVARGYALFYGALGENLTVRGLDRRQMRAGQRYRVGQALIELTKLRAPCATLDVYGTALGRELWDARIKAGDAGSPRWGMGGFYAAVIESGVVRPDDAITLLEQVA